VVSGVNCHPVVVAASFDRVSSQYRVICWINFGHLERSLFRVQLNSIFNDLERTRTTPYVIDYHQEKNFVGFFVGLKHMTKSGQKIRRKVPVSVEKIGCQLRDRAAGKRSLMLVTPLQPTHWHFGICLQGLLVKVSVCENLIRYFVIHTKLQ